MTKVFTMIAMLALAGSLAAQMKPSPSIAGKWTMTMEMSMGTATPTLEFRQEGEKITGSYTGRYGVSPLEGTLKGLALQFTVEMEAEGQVVLLGFSGEVAADGQTMKGKAVLGRPWGRHLDREERKELASTVRWIPGIIRRHRFFVLARNLSADPGGPLGNPGGQRRVDRRCPHARRCPPPDSRFTSACQYFASLRRSEAWQCA